MLPTYIAAVQNRRRLGLSSYGKAPATMTAAMGDGVYGLDYGKSELSTGVVVGIAAVVGLLYFAFKR